MRTLKRYLCAVMLLSLLTGLFTSGIAEGTQTGTVNAAAGAANLYERADEGANVIFSVQNGTAVAILGVEGNYYHVQAAGASGYILANNITLSATGAETGGGETAGDETTGEPKGESGTSEGESGPKAASASTFSAVTAYLKAAMAGEKVQVFETTDIEGPMLGFYDDGTQVTLLEDGGMCKVQIASDSKIGYVQNAYISLTPPPPPGPTPLGTAYVNMLPYLGAKASVYDSASTSGNKVAEAATGAAMSYFSWVDGGFAEVEYAAGQKGFVQTQHLSKTAVSEPVSAGTAYVKPITGGDTPNVYETGSASGTPLGQLSEGGSLPYFAWADDWVQVNHGNRIAYVQTKYLSKTPIEPPETPLGTAYVTMLPLLGAKASIYDSASTSGNKVAEAATGAAMPYFSWADGGFAKVEYATGQKGFVQTQHLSKTAVSEPTAAGTAYVKALGSGEVANVYEQNSASGTPLGQLSTGTSLPYFVWASEWVQVNYQNRIAYVQTKYLSQAPVPTPPPPLGTAYVNPGTLGGMVTLYSQASTGSEPISAFAAGTAVKYFTWSGGWAQVEVDTTSGKLKGFMQTSLLSLVPVNPGQGYTGPAWVKMPNYGESTNLYQQATASSTVLGTYGTGKGVTILTWGPQWCEVQVDTLRGYVQTQYLSSAYVAPETPGRTGTAWVKMPNAGDRLGLYTQASAASTVQAYYANGTSVNVLSWVNSEWCKVQVGSLTGYMQAQHLTFDPISGSFYAIVSMPSAYDRLPLYQNANLTGTPIGTYVHGTRVYVLTWNTVSSYVDINGTRGYMQSKYLTPETQPQTVAYVKAPGLYEKVPMFSTASTSGSLLGSYSTGTKVNIVTWGSEWSFIEINGTRGYMQTKFLSYNDPGSGGLYAVVNNPNPKDYLNLRESPSTSARVLGQYYNGTPVWVLEYGSTWCKVNVNGIVGYMMTVYLKFTNSPTPTPTPTPGGTGYAVVSNQDPGDRLNLRQQPTTASASLGKYYNGTVVRILEYGATWCRVEVGGRYGYMMTMYLSFTGGPSPTPTPPPSGYTYAYVKNPVATQRLNLRQSPSTSAKVLGQYYNGTLVKILSYGPTWCHVEVNGIVGHMMTMYLSFSGTVPPPASTTRAVVNNPVATQWLNLRESPSTGARVLGKYFNGVIVSVTQYGTTWCKVYVDGVSGWMMTKYLRFL